ncbi:hypothetical protein KCU85_g46, partial [Aureobasidium melanogenum]
MLSSLAFSFTTIPLARSFSILLPNLTCCSCQPANSAATLGSCCQSDSLAVQEQPGPLLRNLQSSAASSKSLPEDQILKAVATPVLLSIRASYKSESITRWALLRLMRDFTA